MDILSGLHIDGLAHGGSAVARADDGRVVFVAGGCPGDVVDARVTVDHGRYLEAEIASVVTPSEERRTPPCPYFGRCGGCQWQHVSYAAQADAKRTQLIDSLERIGKVTGVEVGPTILGPSPYGYRNRLEMRTGTGPSGHLSLGLTAAHSDEIVPIDSCMLLPERHKSLPKSLGGALRYLSTRAPFALERVAVRVGINTRELEIDLWGPPGPMQRHAVARTLSDAVRTTCVTRVLVKEDARNRTDLKVEVLSGKGNWRERLGEFEYRVSAPSFFQGNTKAAELLVGLVLDRLSPDGSDRVLDLYAGVGTFTLPLAELAGEVVAVEGAGSAVRDLRANLEENGLPADVLPGDAARALADAGTFDLAVVDPPRSGMMPDALKALVRTRARTICYVSCDTATLARDAKALTEAGYTLTSAQPVDLFPQTWHVETVAVFERTDQTSVPT
ncbi:MAG TPA: 23S rRNA (uracil(1939)-C(5))-methyltransferase RlmD [Coriobacteriia bacterium]